MLYKDILDGVFSGRKKEIIEYTNDLLEYYIDNCDINIENLCETNRIKIIDEVNEDLNILCFLAYRGSYSITVVNNLSDIKRNFYIYREFVLCLIDKYVKQFITVDYKILNNKVIDRVTSYDKKVSHLDLYINCMANVLLEYELLNKKKEKEKKKIHNKNKRLLSIVKGWCEEE